MSLPNAGYIGARPSWGLNNDEFSNRSGIWSLNDSFSMRSQGYWTEGGGYLYEILLVGGGGGGGVNRAPNGSFRGAGGGGGGGVVHYPVKRFFPSTTLSLSVGGSYQDTTFQGLVTALKGGAGGSGNINAYYNVCRGESGGSGGGTGGPGDGGLSIQPTGPGCFTYGGNSLGTAGVDGTNGGGANFTSSISGTSVTYSVGGLANTSGANGAANTGNGGASGNATNIDIGEGYYLAPGAGGSGVIILRTVSSNPALASISAGLTYTVNTSIAPGFRIYRFTAGSGTITI